MAVAEMSADMAADQRLATDSRARRATSVPSCGWMGRIAEQTRLVLLIRQEGGRDD
jgi:hypothetical protein